MRESVQGHLGQYRPALQGEGGKVALCFAPFAPFALAGKEGRLLLPLFFFHDIPKPS